MIGSHCCFLYKCLKKVAYSQYLCPWNEDLTWLNHLLWDFGQVTVRDHGLVPLDSQLEGIGLEKAPLQTISQMPGPDTSE